MYAQLNAPVAPGTMCPDGAYQVGKRSIVPNAVRVFEVALDSDDQRVALASATKLMEGIRVLNNSCRAERAAAG